VRYKGIVVRPSHLTTVLGLRANSLFVRALQLMGCPRMDFPTGSGRCTLIGSSIQKLNLLDTVSPIVVWLSDQIYGGDYASPHARHGLVCRLITRP
jgi:hypothetical protein